MNHRTGWAPEDGSDPPASDSPGAAQSDQLSTAEVLQLLVVQTRDYAVIEMERQKLRASLLGAAGRDAAILGIAALFLLSGALVVLLVGCIIALAPLIGPFLATLVVVAVTLMAVALLLLIAFVRVRSAARAAFPGEEPS